MKAPRLCLGLLFLLTLAVAETRADTLVITGGSLTVVDRGHGSETSFSVFGTNFSFSGGAFQLPTPGCDGCAVGRTASPNFRMLAGNVGITIDGVSYHWRETVIGNALFFTGPSFVLTETITLPFTATGGVNFLDNNGVEVKHTFVGQGFVTLHHRLVPFGVPTGPSYEFVSATYTFTAEPVPEPATLALLATGLAGACAAARRRRRASKNAGR